MDDTTDTTTAPPTSPDDDPARGRILDAADRLFYEQGLRAVGMDRIRDESGVSLKRIYREFPAKEELVAATLRRRDQTFQEAITAYLDGLGSARDRVLGVFDFLDAWFREPDFRGCGFINAFAEMGGSSDCVAGAVRHQKQAFRDLLARLVAEAGAPAALADQLFVLANGAMASAAILDAPSTAHHARSAAEALLAAALPG